MCDADRQDRKIGRCDGTERPAYPALQNITPSKPPVTQRLVYHSLDVVDGKYHVGYYTDTNENWLCDADLKGQPLNPCNGGSTPMALNWFNSQPIYHPWLKKSNGEYSAPYYSDRRGRWLCEANENGEPIQRPCDGSASHDHTLSPHRFRDGTIIGGTIDPEDPMHTW